MTVIQKPAAAATISSTAFRFAVSGIYNSQLGHGGPNTAAMVYLMQLSLFDEQNKDKILTDLFQAYFDARKNKRNTINALAFEQHFEARLFALFDELVDKSYEPKPSICFVVDRPVKREIFAADFRDRVIHHFIFNCISPIFENTFVTTAIVAAKAKEHIMVLAELTGLFVPVRRITAKITIS